MMARSQVRLSAVHSREELRDGVSAAHLEQVRQEWVSAQRSSAVGGDQQV